MAIGTDEEVVTGFCSLKLATGKLLEIDLITASGASTSGGSDELVGFSG